MPERGDPIAPVYATSEPNEDIPLGEEKVDLILPDMCTSVTAEAWIRFLPRPRLVFEGALQSPDLMASAASDELLKIRFRGRLYDAILLRVSASGIVFSPTTEPITVQSCDGQRIRRVVFHLLDFPEFYCLGEGSGFDRVVETQTGWCRLGFVALSAGGWKITLSAMPSTGQMVRKLKKTGGYAITHVGILEREDGHLFDEQPAEQVLSALRHFLSFARGLWVEPALPVGFGLDGELVFERWGFGVLHPWRFAWSWFDEYHGEVLAQVFPGFWSAWQDAHWSDLLRRVLYWYLASNAAPPAVDLGIILSQSALELLAWGKCAVQASPQQKAAFKELRASDKIRRLLCDFGLRCEIPPDLSDLHSAATAAGWLDGPHAITGLRNQLVHPEPKYRGLGTRVYYEAWNLAQQYVELVILKLCGHKGVYANRLRPRAVGEVSIVP